MKKSVLFLIAAALLAASCSRVDPGYVGVKVKMLGQNKGVAPQQLDVGRYWMGWFYELYTYPTTVTIYPFTAGKDEGSEIPEAIIFQDKDGVACDVDIALSAHADPTKATAIFQTYRKEMTEIIKSYCRQDINNFFVEYSSTRDVEELYSTEKMPMLAYVKMKLKEKYGPTGVIIDDIAYKSNIRFPENVMAAINEKIAATQLALKKEQEVMQAEADAKKMVAAADGEARSILMRANAQAEANRKIAASISETLVRYELAIRWDGKSPVYSGNGSVLPPLFK